tara:strand:- start:7741 stop:8727 length:987 start_codon:yes stop_codon:yes gene_type:complete
MSETITAEEPTTQDVEVADLSTAQLEAFLSGQPASEAPAEPEPEPEPEATAEAEPEAQPEPEAGVQEEEAPLNKQRIRPRQAQDQQVIDLYKSDGFDGTFQEAVEVIYGKDSPAENVSGASPRVEPDNSLAEKITGLQGEVTELESKIDEAAEEMETQQAMKLSRELQRKEAEIFRLQMQEEETQRRAEETEFETYRQRAVESQNRAVEAIPELADANSVTRKHFDSFVEQKRNDPDYAPVFGSPKWPELLAREYAAQHPQAPAPAPQGEPVRVVSQNPSTNPQTKVLTSADAPQQPTNTNKLSADAVLSNLDKVSTNSLYDLLGGRR